MNFKRDTEHEILRKNNHTNCTNFSALSNLDDTINSKRHCAFKDAVIDRNAERRRPNYDKFSNLPSHREDTSLKNQSFPDDTVSPWTDEHEQLAFIGRNQKNYNLTDIMNNVTFNTRVKHKKVNVDARFEI